MKVLSKVYVPASTWWWLHFPPRSNPRPPCTCFQFQSRPNLTQGRGDSRQLFTQGAWCGWKLEGPLIGGCFIDYMRRRHKQNKTRIGGPCPNSAHAPLYCEGAELLRGTYFFKKNIHMIAISLYWPVSRTGIGRCSWIMKQKWPSLSQINYDLLRK